jgi:hypothetical protein
MGVSAPDSRSHVPGFRDRLGERLTVGQPSGAELEYLYFCQTLASAPFFVAGLKTRVARLARFTHGSYTRVRRVQHTTDLEAPIALVSTHVSGRRLAEILDVAARAELKPTTAAVLALTRQLMTGVALLHDFAPDGFHGAIGPERLILAGDGRVVIAEHVLGTVVEQAVGAWGAATLWQDFRLAALPSAGLAQYGRRVDVVQVGLIALATLLGRPLDGAAFPDGLAPLLAEVVERQPDGTGQPLRQGLRDWLERTLALRGDASFQTLLESQKAMGQLVQDGTYAASPAGWDTFVRACETAALRVPVVVVVPEPAEAATGTAEHAGEAKDGGGERSEAMAKPKAEGETTVTADPFGPWPVPLPAESAATLFDTYLAADPPAEPAPPVKLPVPAAPAKPTADPWAQPKASPIHPEPLFEAPKVDSPSTVTGPSDSRPPDTGHSPIARPIVEQPTSVADWQAPEPTGPAAVVPPRVGASERRGPAFETLRKDRRDLDTRRWVRLLIIALLAGVATAAAVYAPTIWVLANETLRTFGTVTVESDPPGALISVDGQMRGHTPADLRLQPGDHVVEVQTGGSAKSRTITLAARARITERFTLPEAGERGGFRITTYPAPGRITIDGKLRGDAPVKVTDLTPGTHTLVVETTLGTQEQDVIVQPGAVLQLAVPTASWVKVKAPFDLNVLEDGRLIGTTASGPVLVKPGRHYLDFANRELGVKLRQFVDAVPGQVVTVPLDLPTGMMNVYADQTADVYVDGERVGETPLPSLQLPLGSHEVVLRHPRYGEVRYSVRVTLAAPVNLNVTLRK